MQHIEYVPFGEVFVEERNNIWNTPYLFNAKEFDEETGLYYYGARYYDPRVNLWISVDPLAENKPNYSSYNFVSNNPLSRVDFWGLTDYEVDGQKRTINDGNKDLRIAVGKTEFTKLQQYFNKNRFSYDKYMNRLSVKNGYTTFGVCKDTESSIGYAISVMAHRPGGQSYSEWSIDNKSTFSPYFEALDAPFTIAGSAAEQFKNVNVGSNGKWYFKHKSGTIFNGNQYVTTTPANVKYSGIIKGTARVSGAITVVSSGYDIYQGYVQDGGHFGYNATIQTAGAVGGFAGGAAGAKIGATIGASIGGCFGGVGAVPGGIIGGFIGGAVGAWYGNDFGKDAEELEYKIINGYLVFGKYKYKIINNNRALYDEENKKTYPVLSEDKVMKFIKAMGYKGESLLGT